MSVIGSDSGLPSDRASWLGMSRREVYVLLAILAIQLVLVSPSLMPSFPQINAFDEAQYVGSGRLLLHFEVRDMAWGPLVAVLYAPLHLLLGWSRDWFVLETWAGRILLFSCLWVCTVYLAGAFRDHLPPYVMAGVLFVSVPFTRVVENQSDALVASLSVVILGLLVRMRHKVSIRGIGVGSVLLGLCVLSRAEALSYLVLFPIVVVWLVRGRIRALRALAASTLPAFTVIFIYLAFFAWSTGGLNLGFTGKSYRAFQDHQPIAAGSPTSTPKEETARLYGTPEENGNSVLRAVVHNPVAFARRVATQALTLPGFFLGFFEKKLGPAIALLCLWGVYDLFDRRQFAVLAVMGAWSLEPMGSIPFVTWHFVSQLSPVFLVLSALGISRLLNRLPDLRAHSVHILSFAVLALLGLIFGTLALTVAGFAMTGALILASVATGALPIQRAHMMVGSMLVLAAGLILRNPYPFPNYAALGTSPEEQVIHFLEASVPHDSLLLAPLPGPAIAARLSEISPADVPQDARTPQGFLSWVRSHHVAAIYLDRQFQGSAEVYDVADSLTRQGDLELAFTSRDGRIRVLLPKP